MQKTSRTEYGRRTELLFYLFWIYILKSPYVPIWDIWAYGDIYMYALTHGYPENHNDLTRWLVKTKHENIDIDLWPIIWPSICLLDIE